MLRSVTMLVASIALLAGCQDQASGSGSRDRIRVVGSSTVYPFTTLVAEQFVNQHPTMQPPVIESTGTGGGFKQFCEGLGANTPDIADASRRMKASEYAACKRNGASHIIEVQIGIDGIAFAEAQNGPKLRLTAADLYKALAATPGGQPNASRTWHDVNPSLPPVPIQVYGPPSTSGTRDAMADLILARGCEASYPAAIEMKTRQPEEYGRACTTIRTDGPYVDAGENDNLIVQKLQANPNALGVFGYSYLEENRNTLQGVPLNGIEPTTEAIAAGIYPGSRPLFIYVKKAHLVAVHGLKEFLATYASSWGPGSPLAKRGLIVAPANVRQQSAATIARQQTLNPASLT